MLHLSDALRDQLAHQLAVPSHVPAARRIMDILFAADPAHCASSRSLADALLGLQTGTGPQVVQIENLPPGHEAAFTSALFTMLQGDTRRTPIEVRPNQAHHDVGLHQDAPYSPNSRKIIRTLVVKDPGTRPDPTIFITADEVLHAMACEQIGLTSTTLPADIPPNEARQHAEALSALVERYRSIRVHTENIYQDHGEEHAFLQQNTHYTPGSNAPQFFLCTKRHNERHLSSDSAATTAFYAMAEQLRDRAAKESSASMHPHSMVIWNDMGVLHDRAGALQQERKLLSTCARPLSACARITPHERFSGAPSVPVTPQR